MDINLLLQLLKADLQIINTANDYYLTNLLEQAQILIEQEGATLAPSDINHQLLVVQYASYLFTKRRAPETAMPRILRYNLNNLVFSQKVGES